MTDSEKLDLILEKVNGLDEKVNGLDEKVNTIESDMQEIKRRTTNIELHLENGTDKNIQLLAENYIELTNKLNQAIPAADKNLAYEVKVNYLVEKVQILEKEVAELKSKTA